MMKNKVNIGDKFGNLVVDRLSPEKKWGSKAWLCSCDCGSRKIQIRTTHQLTSNKKTHCGCNHPTIKNLKGKNFGFLKVTDGPFKNTSGRITWQTLCICGTIQNTASKILINGDARSCGCKGAYKAINDWTLVPPDMLPFTAYDSPERKLNTKYGPYLCKTCHEISLFYSFNSECCSCRQIKRNLANQKKLDDLQSKDHLHLIVTLKEAKDKGLKRYFNAIPCPKGHIADRWTINQACCVCSAIRGKQTDKELQARYGKTYNAKPDSKAKRNKQLTERRRTDPTFQIMEVCRTRIKSVFKKKKVPKTGVTLELIGCGDWEILRNWIEAQFYNHPVTGEIMSWDNRENRWEIDHILPIGLLGQNSSFEQQKKICNYKNLQPLWKEDHIKKTRKAQQDNRALK